MKDVPALVLVVAGSLVVRESWILQLRAEGYAVRGAVGAVDALELATREQPDAIVCGLGLDGADAFALCAFFRQEGHLQDVPVILVGERRPIHEHWVAAKAGAFLVAEHNSLVDAVDESVQRHS